MHVKGPLAQGRAYSKHSINDNPCCNTWGRASAGNIYNVYVDSVFYFYLFMTAHIIGI